MSDRKTTSKDDNSFAREDQDNKGAVHTSPQVPKNKPHGAADADTSVSPTADGGVQPTKNPDQGEVGTLNEATTSDGGIAVDGGKLEGNKDDFEGEIGTRTGKVPGAQGPGAEHKPSDKYSG